MFKFPKDLIIIDVETTGIDINRSSIIQLGAVVFNRKGYIESNTFNEYVLPYTNEWTEESQKVHKIEKSRIEKIGKPLAQMIYDFEYWANSFYPGKQFKHNFWLAQWSCSFDIALLQNAYKKLGKKYPFHYRNFDVASIVRFELAKQGKLEMKCGEDKCAHSLGLNFEKANLHNALYDVMLSGKMLEKIIKDSKC